MLPEPDVSRSSLGFSNSNYDYDNDHTNAHVSSHLCEETGSIDLATWQKI
jgi:hypothetical protein